MDVWLLVMELSCQLQAKQVYVKVLSSSPLVYINVTQLYEAVTVHPTLGKTRHPYTSLGVTTWAFSIDWQNNFFLQKLDYIYCEDQFVYICANSIEIIEES